MNNNHTQYIVQKLWNYCNILRDDGMSYGDYVEQLTYLLFLKMAHERAQLSLATGQGQFPIVHIPSSLESRFFPNCHHFCKRL